MEELKRASQTNYNETTQHRGHRHGHGYQQNKKYKLCHPLVRLVITLKDRTAAPAAAPAAAAKSNRATLEVKIYVQDPAVRRCRWNL